MYRELREQAEDCREDLTALTQLLVRTPSFSFREETAAGIVQDLLEELHYDLVFRDGVGNVIGFLAGSGEGPTILLNSHMDTRRPDEERLDPDGPFSGRIERGRMRGLGTAGCKSGLAAQVFAGHILDKSLIPLYGTIVVAATVAQEEGNGAGVRYLLEETLPKLGVTPDLAILGEPTTLLVCGGHDGWADIDVRIACGDAAATRRATGLIQNALTGASAHASWKAKRSSLHVSDPVYCEHDGSQEATLCVRCRVKSGEAVANCVGLVKRLALTASEPAGDVRVEVHVHNERRRFYTGKTVEVLCWNNPWSSDPSAPLFHRALDALAAAGWRDAAVRTLGLNSLRLGTAGSLLADSYHIPTLCFGPGDENRAYTREESVDVEKLVDAVFGTAVLVHGAIGTPLSLVWPTHRAPRDPGRVSTSRDGR